MSDELKLRFLGQDELDRFLAGLRLAQKQLAKDEPPDDQKAAQLGRLIKRLPTHVTDGAIDVDDQELLQALADLVHDILVAYCMTLLTRHSAGELRVFWGGSCRGPLTFFPTSAADETVPDDPPADRRVLDPQSLLDHLCGLLGAFVSVDRIVDYELSVDLDPFDMWNLPWGIAGEPRSCHELLAQAARSQGIYWDGSPGKGREPAPILSSFPETQAKLAELCPSPLASGQRRGGKRRRGRKRGPHGQSPYGQSKPGRRRQRHGRNPGGPGLGDGGIR